MRSQVKICGLTRPEDVETAIEYGASFLGFIVEAKSPRRLSIEQTRRLIAPTKGTGVSTVAVMVNPSQDLFWHVMEEAKPDFIQLHGDEPPQYFKDLKRRYRKGLDRPPMAVPYPATIKALSISSAADMAQIQDYIRPETDLASLSPMILLDAKPPKGAKVRGGHGLSFDWTLIKTAKLPRWWALAGGLTPENVAEAAARTNAPILDVSSGVESAPGIKDASKIKAFMDAVKHG